MDSRMQALHALLQDHTYVQWPVEKQTPSSSTNFTSSSTNKNNNGTLLKTATDTSLVVSNISEPSTSCTLSFTSNKSKQSVISEATVTTTVGCNASLANQSTSSNILSKYPKTNSTSLITGYPFGYNELTSMIR